MPDIALSTAEAVCDGRKAVAAAKQVRLPGDARRAWRLVVSLNVLGLMLLAVVLRCRNLGNLPGINGDEAWYGLQAELCLRGEPIAWRTPSGNLLNPLFFGPQLAMHAIFAPSFVVLRATAVTSGLLALVVNFWLCRRVFGRKIAILSTTILAVLPIDLAYSRLAWDASQSLLATLPCVYFPIWAISNSRLRLRCSMAAFTALAIAIVVHPTNIFVAPITTVCLGCAWRDELRRAGRWIAGCCLEKRRRIALAATLGGVVVIGAIGVGSQLQLRPAWVGPAIARAASPPQYGLLIANFGRLFSGASVYEYLSGEMNPPASPAGGKAEFRWDCVPYDLAAWIVGSWLLCGLIRAGRRNRPELVYLAVGFGASLFGFFLVAGPGGLAPDFERYAIWMVGPTAILAALALGAWQARLGKAEWLSTIAAIAIGWAFLLGFQTNCLGFLKQTGGRSYQTFRTAAVEPKQAALAYILAQRKPNETVQIVTSEWWIYWPMRYLSMGPRSRDFESPVSFELQATAHSRQRLLAMADLGRGRLWFVEFSDSAACEAIRQAARSKGRPMREIVIDDFSGRPLLSLFVAAPSRDVHDSEKN